MSNPITAVLSLVSTTSEAAVTGIEGTSAYLTLWRDKQKIEHKRELKTYSLESLENHAKRCTRAKEALASYDPEIIQWLEA